MLQCRDIDELMIDFLYQELETPRADAFKAHLATCPRCGQELSSLQRVRGALRELPEAEPPQSVTAKLLHEAAKRAKPVARDEARGGIVSWLGSFFRPLVAHPAWAAAASLVLVLGAVVFMKSRGVDEKTQSHPDMIPTSQSEPAMAAKAPRAEKAGEWAATPPEVQAAAPVTAPVGAELEPMDPSASDKFAPDALTIDGRFRAANGTKPRVDEVNEVDGKDREARAVSSEEERQLDLAKKGLKSGAGDDNVLFDDVGRGRAGGKSGVTSRGYTSPGGSGTTGSINQEKSEDGAGGVEGGQVGGVVGGVVAGRADTGATGRRESKPADPSTDPAPKQDAPKPDAVKPAKKMPQRELEERVAAEDDGDADAPQPNYWPAPTTPPEAPAKENKPDVAKVTVKEKTKGPPAAPPPPSTTAKPTTSVPTRDTTVVKTESKNVPAKDAKAAPVDPKKLHEQAKTQANSGDCTAAITTRNRIQKVDTDYYNRNVRNDKVFAPCDRRVQEQKNRKTKQQPADEMESPAPVDTATGK